jgi:hypothetical protein
MQNISNNPQISMANLQEITKNLNEVKQSEVGSLQGRKVGIGKQIVNTINRIINYIKTGGWTVESGAMKQISKEIRSLKKFIEQSPLNKEHKAKASLSNKDQLKTIDADRTMRVAIQGRLKEIEKVIGLVSKNVKEKSADNKELMKLLDEFVKLDQMNQKMLDEDNALIPEEFNRNAIKAIKQKVADQPKEIRNALKEGLKKQRVKATGKEMTKSVKFAEQPEIKEYSPEDSPSEINVKRKPEEKKAKKESAPSKSQVRTSSVQEKAKSKPASDVSSVTISSYLDEDIIRAIRGVPFKRIKLFTQVVADSKPQNLSFSLKEKDSTEKLKELDKQIQQLAKQSDKEVSVKWMGFVEDQSGKYHLVSGKTDHGWNAEKSSLNQKSYGHGYKQSIHTKVGQGQFPDEEYTQMRTEHQKFFGLKEPLSLEIFKKEVLG